MPLMRSVLYIPAHKPRALQKLPQLDCDAVILDLEDAVPPAQKDAARDHVLAALRTRPETMVVLLRINAGDEGDADLLALKDAAIDGVVIPKVRTKAELDHLADQTDLPLWPMVETPQAVLNIATICAHSAVQGVVMGLNDLGLEAGIKARSGFVPHLAQVVMAARAHNRLVLDGVYNRFEDETGLQAECAEAVALGFDGKTLIHPQQVSLTNAAFAPSAAAVDDAKRLLAQASDGGAEAHDGMMVEALHRKAAEQVLAMHQAIEAKGQ